MNKLLPILAAVAVLVAGAAAVIIADRQGWLGANQEEGGAAPGTAQCRHQLAAEDCPFCTPALIEKLGFCGGHNVPEALCTRCNRSLVAAFKVENDWCVEHDLPESQCVICNPSIAGGNGSEPAVSAIETVAAGEFTPRSQRPPTVSCAIQQRVVQFASADIARNAGIQTEPVRRQPVSFSLSCSAELAFNGDRMAHLAPRAPGVVHGISSAIGDRVQSGEALAVIDSTELGTAKADYLQSLALVNLWRKNHQRQAELSESGITARSALLEAQTRLAESEISSARAKQRLRNLGLGDEQIVQVEETNDTTSLLPMTAPFEGVIIDRRAALGEVVDSSDAIFSIADPNVMWAMLDIQERDIRNVMIGQPIVLAINGFEGEQFSGVITWLASSIDPQTRTLKARADVRNPDLALRAGMFGIATVQVSQKQEQVVVPKSAVQWEGCCNVVFVRHTDTVFQPYKVQLGFQAGDYWVVAEGLEAGEEIVTQGAFLLKTEILRGSIGAGCCEVHAAKE